MTRLPKGFKKDPRKEFHDVLQAEGFKFTDFIDIAADEDVLVISDGGAIEDNVLEYKKIRGALDKKYTLVEVQLWSSGQHRASSMANGSSCGLPTDFSTTTEMLKAIDKQWKLAAKNRSR